MERVLVTGAASMIGRLLVAYLRRRGFWVRAADRRPCTGPANETVSIVGNARDPISRVVAGVGHVYALDGPMDRDRPRAPGAAPEDRAGLDEEILWTAALAGAAAEAGVDRFLYVPPGCVHAASDERASCCLARELSRSILDDLEERTGMETRTAILPNVYGPWANDDEAAASPVNDAARLAAGVPAEDGVLDVGPDVPTAFCSAEDCVDGLYALMRSNHRQPMLVSGPERVTFRRIASMLSRMAERPMPTVESTGARVFSAPAASGDTRTLIGWEHRTPLQAGLQSVLAHAREAANA